MKFEKIEHREDYQKFTARLLREGFSVTLSGLIEEAYHKHQTPITFFFRDDDSDELTANLVHLLDLFVEKQIPLHLLVIPKRVTRESVNYLRKVKQGQPNLVFLCQHGFSHENHNRSGKKCEFGGVRTQTAQFLDIVAGKDKMSELFLNDFFLAFTPPWNRYNNDTLISLKQLGFQVLSADGGNIGLIDFDLFEISTDVDLYHRRPQPELKSPSQVLFEIRESLITKSTVGILLHHHEMQLPDFSFIRRLLTILKVLERVEFPNFAQIYQKYSNQRAYREKHVQTCC
ncbi:MAG: DUF2334 domain-containing protein [bacterium]